ncbi:tRNA uridine-5-carboxymethylaminomethyl(34) synthesis GTPase MnmE [Maritimibacter sp. 55A14]|uniref:tRNA uridine-5-carboxymethylaminomethyl(34) synthesis GTPase MnmE n=1 Tax=Maritimibacter sp. 55A14 TaxID=2174844 RepID=UPI000D60C9B4|nr:tRNA uridine-5-carboxymethylaminomethyl(34) synthesis GTPase MnmE [Maritimibacter sp. 55A14]PWE33568.1 tRNA uridine-5-carboxymethylaminomethyl(34) synthesis GTPase MnmE [Maritimibacter sp. 55A14]
MDTIYALATARGKSGVAVIRLSGPDAHAAAESLAGPLPPPRQSTLRVLRDADGGHLDQALVLLFLKGASFTGEDVAELHLHGSPAIIRAVLRELGDRAGLRMAEPGEFTRRALENGCLDLVQVEGLGDLIEAETEAQRKQALRVFEGALGRKVEAWRSALIRAAALLEATIDFADEEVPVEVTPEVTGLLDGVAEGLRAEIAGSRAAERIRDGFEVAIVGAPNAGKSTLLNALAGREAAITSEVAGTTRDVIEVAMDLNGVPATILDTAGLRDAQDMVEGMGIDRALKRAREADLRVFLHGPEGDIPGVVRQPGDIDVLGKADLGRSGEGLPVSGKTGAGIAELVGRVAAELEMRAQRASTATRERHRLAMESALGAMESARIEVLNGPDRAELAAENLHAGIRALDSVIGRVDVEHILDEIFARFCLGK